MRTLFFGTPEIAVPSFNALHDISEIVAVICQPDRPAGRGMKLKAPPIKQRALELGLEVIQPTKIKTESFAEWIRSREADVALVMAYGRILPEAVLAGPKHGCINVHASQLPRYRGAAPINWAIVRGETETGICLMQMDKGCDTGPVYCMRAHPIGPDQTAGELAAELGELAAAVVREELPRAVAGQLQAVAQDDEAATLAPLLRKEDGLVDWSLPAPQVHNHVRGMTPWPGAFTWIADRRFKLIRTRLAEPEGELAAPGTILSIDQSGAEIACGDGSIRLLEGQLEGRKACSAAALAAGRCIGVGQCFTKPDEP